MKPSLEEILRARAILDAAPVPTEDRVYYPPESFADHPMSIGEVKAERSQDAADWSPRDALIDVLREIDSGKIKPTALIIAFSAVEPDGESSFGKRMTGNDLNVALGLATRFIYAQQSD